jgi:hypothetical protein
MADLLSPVSTAEVVPLTIGGNSNDTTNGEFTKTNQSTQGSEFTDPDKPKEAFRNYTDSKRHEVRTYETIMDVIEGRLTLRSTMMQ